jgi:putative phosphoribosyl transferase
MLLRLALRTANSGTQKMTDSKRTIHEVVIPAGKARLDGILSMPKQPTGLVIFAHGSGSSRLSPRNRLVADALNTLGLATLLFDLLLEKEEKERAHVFDIDLLTERLVAATGWAIQNEATALLRIGYFGASTGAAAALAASVQLPRSVQAIVSRGGRPDLASSIIPHVVAPVLLIVGSLDTDVVEMNNAALAHIQSTKRLSIVKDASHLFEEPGTLMSVAELAGDWFLRYLAWPEQQTASHAG